MKIQLKILDHAKEFYEKEKLPQYAKPGDIGLDLRCIENVTIYPGETQKIRTGIAIWLGSAHEGQEDKWAFWNSPYIKVGAFILPRSGLGSDGLILANTIGVIDENYQGELVINAWNRNQIPKVLEYQVMFHEKVSFEEASKKVWKDTIYLKAGQRIAQLVIMPVFNVEWDNVGDFNERTERQEDGFGSSGE